MTSTHDITKTTAFDGVVSSLIQIAEGEVALRKHVADYVNAGGTVKELHVQLTDLDDKRAHKSLGYLRNIQTSCVKVGLLPAPTGQGSRGSLMNELPVENPFALSDCLPTQRDVKAYAAAPLEVKQQVQAIAVESPNQDAIDHVRSLINDDYEIDVSSHTKEELGEMLKHHSSEINGLVGHSMFTDMAMQATMSEYGSFNSQGEWYAHSPLRVIKNLIPQLSSADKQELINLLIPSINV